MKFNWSLQMNLDPFYQKKKRYRTSKEDLNVSNEASMKNVANQEVALTKR